MRDCAERRNALAEAGREAMPIRFDDCRNVVIHDTVDPEGIVVQYELVGTITTTSRHPHPDTAGP